MTTNDAHVDPVQADYTAICKELGCIEKTGVPLRFVQEMRKSLSAAHERIDWLLRSWDDATITERQELDRMRRGWGPTTPTERMLRHGDLRDCMQALSGALTDLTTPENGDADLEVEAYIQAAYDRVNKRYLESLEILNRLDEPLQRPDLEPRAMQSATAGGAVKVKPLVWGSTSYGRPEALSVVGTYRINEAWSGGWAVAVKNGVLRAPDGRSNFATIEAAQAAAQADYEQRILAALEPTPAPEPGSAP